MTLRELYDKAVNLSRQERINLARNSGGAVLEYLEGRGFGDKERFEFLVYITALFAGADGAIDADETRLFNDILGSEFAQNDLNEQLRGYFNGEFVESMDRVVDSFPEEAKANVCFYGLAFVSADGTISAREQQVFEKILA